MSSDYEGKIDLESLIGDIKPNMVTPHLDQLTSAQNNRKTKVLAELMISSMVNAMTDPVKKEIIHKGQIHAVRYVNVEPLLNGGPWAGISLMLLNLSYGEQSTIIESTYPERLQFSAKAFAVVFTPELKQTTITINQDEEVLGSLEEVKAGISMILAKMDGGYIPHADELLIHQSEMEDLADTMTKRKNFKKASTTSQNVAKSGDLVK